MSAKRCNRCKHCPSKCKYLLLCLSYHFSKFLDSFSIDPALSCPSLAYPLVTWIISDYGIKPFLLYSTVYANHRRCFLLIGKAVENIVSKRLWWKMMNSSKILPKCLALSWHIGPAFPGARYSFLCPFVLEINKQLVSKGHWCTASFF